MSAMIRFGRYLQKQTLLNQHDVQCLKAALGHVWTTPALQEEFGDRLAVGCKSCVRPIGAAHDRWP